MKDAARVGEVIGSRSCRQNGERQPTSRCEAMERYSIRQISQREPTVILEDAVRLSSGHQLAVIRGAVRLWDGIDQAETCDPT